MRLYNNLSLKLIHYWWQVKLKIHDSFLEVPILRLPLRLGARYMTYWWDYFPIYTIQLFTLNVSKSDTKDRVLIFQICWALKAQEVQLFCSMKYIMTSSDSCGQWELQKNQLIEFGSVSRHLCSICIKSKCNNKQTTHVENLIVWDPPLICIAWYERHMMVRTIQPLRSRHDL